VVWARGVSLRPKSWREGSGPEEIKVWLSTDEIRFLIDRQKAEKNIFDAAFGQVVAEPSRTVYLFWVSVDRRSKKLTTTCLSPQHVMGLFSLLRSGLNVVLLVADVPGMKVFLKTVFFI
jgi:hypothetical protein